MHRNHARTTLSRALGLALLGLAANTAIAQDVAPAQQPTGSPASSGSVTELDRVQVSGYRSSVQFSTDAKRDSTGFTDSIFAEDIGKFPDMNIAESLQRIPGIQLSRDVNGEGLNVAIRGLPNSFTTTVVNGAPVATASIGLNAQNQNREVDLNLFPTEFFTQLTVNKTPKASLPEGGIAGVVDMRTARPFDRPGTHVTYQLQGTWNDNVDKLTPQGSVLGSWTNDAETFGVLVGVTSTRGKIGVEGYETVGWTNPGLNYTQCGLAPPAGVDGDAVRPAACNAGGGGNWLIPNTVPNNLSTVGAGLTPGAVIDRDLLLALNPGLSIEQISEALIPRLGRPVHMSGDRERDAVVGSLEWRPNEYVRFYLDTMFSKARRTNDRIDVNLVGRNFGANGMIPVDMQVDGNGVVTDATFSNAQFFLEARPYIEDVKYWSVNPGASFLFGDEGRIKLDVQANASRSWMFRESPTILVNSPFTNVQYSNNGGTPSWTTDIDLNDPNAGWTWAGGRVNVQNEKRVTETRGARADLQFGEDRSNIRVGVAYDENSRRIQGFDNSTAWQTEVLSRISDADLVNYLRPGPYGFITADFDAFKNATNYGQYSDSAPESAGPNTGGSTGGFEEKTLGAYIEINGETQVLDRNLRFNAGVRYVTTDQDISGPVTIAGVRQWQTLKGDYDQYLPSFNAAWDVADNVVLRFSGSRTMTRPNPSSMLPNTTFTDLSALNASQGNPNLTPYVSTNFDLGGEWYTGGEGMIGLSLFNKRIEGYTYLGTNTIPFAQLGIPYADLTPEQQSAIAARGGPDEARVIVQQQVNADATVNVRGWELIWVQPLDFLLDGLGIMANYTDIDLSTEGNDSDQLTGNLYGIAPKLWNATAYFERGPFSIRASYNHTDAIVGTGPNQQGIPYAQIIGESRGQWDLSASYTLENVWSKPQITLNVVNLTGETQRSNFWYSNAVNDIYDPGRTIMLGLRGSF